MAELLAEDQFFVLVIHEVQLLVGDHLFDSLVDFSARRHGLFNIRRVLFTDLLADLLNEFGLDAVKDSQEWSLRPLESQPSAHLHRVLFDVLVEHLTVEFGWGLLSELIRQLTTLGLDDVSFSR